MEFNDVKGIAIKLSSKYKNYIPYEDLFQESYICFVYTWEKYNQAVEPERNTSFPTTYFTTLNGWLYRYCMKNSRIVRLPEYLEDMILKFNRFCAEYETKHGYTPSDNEIKYSLSLSKKELELIKKYNQPTCSLDLEIGDEGNLTLADTLEDEINLIEQVDETEYNKVLHQELVKVLEKLEPQQRELLLKVCVSQKKHTKAAAEMGLSVGEERRLFEKAMKTLRNPKYRKTIEEIANWGDARVYEGSFQRFVDKQASVVELVTMQRERTIKRL